MINAPIVHGDTGMTNDSLSTSANVLDQMHTGRGKDLALNPRILVGAVDESCESMRRALDFSRCES